MTHKQLVNTYRNHMNTWHIKTYNESERKSHENQWKQTKTNDTYENQYKYYENQ